jgi:hypothetical protein
MHMLEKSLRDWVECLGAPQPDLYAIVKGIVHSIDHAKIDGDGELLHQLKRNRAVRRIIFLIIECQHRV